MTTINRDDSDKIDNSNSFHEFWKHIEENAIQPLLDYLDGKVKTPLPLKSYMNIYTLVYNKCTCNSVNNTGYFVHKRLYSAHNDTINLFLQKEKAVILNGEARNVLKEFLCIWEKFLILNKWMKMFLYNLDRWYIPEHRCRPLEESGYFVFSQYFLKDLSDLLMLEINSLMIFAREHDNEGIEIISTYVKILDIVDHQKDGSKLLFQQFETSFVEQIRMYYVSLAGFKITTCKSNEYLKFAKESIKSEISLLQRCVPRNSTEKRLQKVLEEELLIKYHKEVMLCEESGLRFLLDHGSMTHIKEMFISYSLLDDDSECLLLMASIFSEFTVDSGIQNIHRHFQSNGGIPIGPNELISSLCNLLTSLNKMVKYDCFQSHVLFERSFERSFKQILHNPLLEGKLVEYLSGYCNVYLSSSGEKIVDEERQIILESAMKLFGYIDDKDYFLNSYRNFLAKRLMHKRSYSNDLERMVILDLRTRCGIQYTSRLEGMIYDNETASDSFIEFCQRDDNAPYGNVFVVRTLTKAFWPLTKNIPCRIPMEILTFQDVYENFYCQKFSGRKLDWIHRLGTVDMDACFFPSDKKTLQKKFLITMNFYHSLVLLQFNDHVSCTLSSLLETTGLPVFELKQILDSLTQHKKFALLEKHECEHSEDTKYKVNESFTSIFRKVKLPSLTFEKEKKKDTSSETLVISDLERGFAIDASLVRIMKMRKILPHKELVSEVRKQITVFQPTIKLLKIRIESLIEREFLLRDDHHVYTYIA